MALFNLGIVLRDDLKDYPGALKAWETFLQKAGDSPRGNGTSLGSAIGRKNRDPAQLRMKALPASDSMGRLVLSLPGVKSHVPRERNSALTCHCERSEAICKVWGLPRRCAPSNDSSGEIASPAFQRGRNDS